LIKSPGSRIGQGDSILQSLKGLKKVLTDKREIDLVEKEIEIRVTLLQSEKISKVVIDRSHIPAHLLHLLKS
jgi:hypothetical protein